MSIYARATDVHAVSIYVVTSGTNVNTSGIVPITYDSGYGKGFSLASNLITCEFDGWVRVSFNIEIASSVARVAPRLWIRQDSGSGPVSVGGTMAQHTYIRFASGHNDSSANMSFPIEVAFDDTLELYSQQGAAAGSATVNSTSRLAVERIA